MRVWAIRHYLGIGRDGRMIEERTAEEIATALGVSKRTVRRWVNEEPLPLVEDMGLHGRWTLYACAMTGDRERFEEYLQVRELLDR